MLQNLYIYISKKKVYRYLTGWTECPLGIRQGGSFHRLSFVSELAVEICGNGDYVPLT